MRKIQLQEFSERTVQRILDAAKHDVRVAVMRGNKRIAWLVGEYDIRSLRDYDRIKSVES